MSTEQPKDIKPKQQQQQQKGKQQKKEKKPNPPKKNEQGEKVDTRKRLDKEQNFPEWYSQIVVQSGLIEYYDISGCYILRPPAYGIWENIQHFIDVRIKKMGVENAYFPMFVSEQTLKKEEDSLHGFTPEVAWVTKSGKDDLQEPIAIRPTSETIIYPAFKNWISGHRDLPMKVNQWCNVVRWEFSHPYPFIRTREFLWQEGHTAFATEAEAQKECRDIMELYASVYEDLLAVPVIRGKKSKGETFPGAYYSLTVECIIPTNGRSVQAATSHHLGQTFSKMFNIDFEDENHTKQVVWQNSWGLSTRSIGVTIMTHGDNKGIVIPPRVAQKQVVIITLHRKNAPNDEMDKKAYEMVDMLNENGVRAFADTNDTHNPGWKYSEYELRGVPLRIELGPRDYENQKVIIVRRDNGKKYESSWNDLLSNVKNIMDEMHNEMYQKALEARDKHVSKVSTWNEFLDELDKRNVCIVPWCQCEECEECIKKRSAADSLARAENKNEEEQLILTGSAKALCIPLQQDTLPEGAVCFQCGKPATTFAVFGRSY